MSIIAPPSSPTNQRLTPLTVKRFLAVFGPGIVVMLADTDVGSVITAGQSTPVDIEFNLAHPAFIVDHVPANGGATIWAVNFNAPLRHRDIAVFKPV